MQLQSPRGHIFPQGLPVRRTDSTKIHADIDKRTMILPVVPRCNYCGAHKIYKETVRFCCSVGEIILHLPQLVFTMMNRMRGDKSRYGQVHHFLNDLVPHDKTRRMQGVQFYFYNPSHQLENRLSVLPRLEPRTTDELINVLELNPYLVFLKQASSIKNIERYNIVIRSENI